MIILRGDNQNVDLKVPLELNEEKLERFLDYFKNNFYFVETIETKNSRIERMGEKLFMREWSSEEEALLFDVTIDTTYMAKMLGRTWMSVDIRRGPVVPEILNFAKKKGVDIYKVNIKELIEEYREEYKDKLLERKKERKERNEKQKRDLIQLERLKEEVPKLKKLSEQGILMNEGELKKKEDELNELELNLAKID
tara:strand:+ start:82 stop:669 length:588 start_codon:yes stop_codon:yes gene_type:complete